VDAIARWLAVGVWVVSFAVVRTLLLRGGTDTTIPYDV
jgi:hypothetical protein